MSTTPNLIFYLLDDSMMLSCCHYVPVPLLTTTCLSCSFVVLFVALMSSTFVEASISLLTYILYVTTFLLKSNFHRYFILDQFSLISGFLRIIFTLPRLSSLISTNVLTTYLDIFQSNYDVRFHEFHNQLHLSRMFLRLFHNNNNN